MTKIEEIKRQVEAINRARRSSQKMPDSNKIERTYYSSTKLFVYGTLGLGETNEHLLLDIGGNWKAATLKGYIERPEPDNNLNYPLLTLDADGVVEKGHVFTSENLPRYWNRLDQFEGPAYIRLLTLVRYENNNWDVVNVYASAAE